MADKPQPVRVLYCGVCDLPAEYCEYGSDFEKCKPWLRVHASNLYPDLLKEESDADKTAQQLQSAPISAFPDAGESDASAVPSGASKMPLLLFDPFC